MRLGVRKAEAEMKRADGVAKTAEAQKVEVQKQLQKQGRETKREQKQQAGTMQQLHELQERVQREVVLARKAEQKQQVIHRHSHIHSHHPLTTHCLPSLTEQHHQGHQAAGRPAAEEEGG